jgi:hypothetical protein
MHHLPFATLAMQQELAARAGNSEKPLLPDQVAGSAFEQGGIFHHVTDHGDFAIFKAADQH